MADKADHVLKDAAYFDELRRAVGRGAPAALFGASGPAIDRSIDSLEKLELQKHPEFYSEYTSIFPLRNGKRRLMLGAMGLVALSLPIKVIGPLWLAFLFLAGGWIAAVGALELSRREKRALREIRHIYLSSIESGPATGTSESDLGVQKRAR